MKSRIVIRALQSVVTLALLLAVFSQVELGEYVDALSRAQVSYLIVMLLLMTCSRLLMPLKWNLLLKTHGIQMPRAKVIQIYYVACFIGQMLPSTVGSDSVRLLITSRAGMSLKSVLSSIIVERFFGMLGLLSFAILGALLLTFSYVDTTAPLQIPLLFLGGAGATLGIILLFWREGISSKILRILVTCSSIRVIGVVVRVFHTLYEALLLYREDRSRVAYFYLLTLLECLVAFSSVWAVTRAFGLEISLSYLFSFLPIQFFLMRMPISVAGWGVSEAGFVYFLSCAGVSPSVGLVVGAVHHLVYLISFTPGAFFMARYDLKEDLSRSLVDLKKRMQRDT